MWGNQRGWILSAILAALMGGLLAWSMVPPMPTAPTGTLTLAMQPADLAIDPGGVLPPPNGDDDAATAYRKAAADWNANKAAYVALSDKITDVAKQVPDAVKQVVAASDDGTMTLFAPNPDEVINYESEHPMLDGLFAAGSLSNSLALRYTTDQYKDPVKANLYADAAFNLGRHLYQERIVFAEWMDGLNLMSDAALILQKTRSDPTDAQNCRDFALAINDFRKDKVERLWEIIGGIGDEDKATYAGDIFQIARESPERMWRVEAILKLGRFKFNAATRGDQFGAKRTLRAMAAMQSVSPDPLTQLSVHSAILAAANLTLEDYRQIK
jgi:hypothetical protein